MEQLEVKPQLMNQEKQLEQVRQNLIDAMSGEDQVKFFINTWSNAFNKVGEISESILDQMGLGKKLPEILTPIIDEGEDEDVTKEFDEKSLQLFKDLEDKKIQLAKENQDILNSIKEEGFAKEEELRQENLEKIKNSLDIIATLQSSISGIFDQLATNRMIGIDNEYKREKENINKNIKDEEKKKIALDKLDKDTEEKRREEKKKTAQINKVTALFDVAINTASAIVEALPNIPLSIAVGALGAVQAGVIASQPIPEFATGVVNMGGAGTATSDSNLALLSKGESVVTAAGTSTGDNSLLLRNMNNGQSFSNATKDLQGLQNTIDGLSAIMANQDRGVTVINEAGREGVTSMVQLGNSDFLNENNRTQQESSI